MPKLLLPIAVVLAVGAAGGATYVLTRGDTVKEVPPPAVQATVTPSPAATETPAAPTPTPTAKPEGTATPDPTADWKTYTDHAGLFTVRYPPVWFEEDGDIYSRDPRTFKGAPGRPPDATIVEITYGPASGSNTCGATISVDAQTGEEVGPLPGATQSSLADAPAWKITRVQGDDPPIEEDLTRVERIATVYKGNCVLITAYFTQEQADESILQEIADTFRFID